MTKTNLKRFFFLPATLGLGLIVNNAYAMWTPYDLFGDHGHYFASVAGGVTDQSLTSNSTTVPNGSGLVAPYNNDTYSIKNPNTGMSFALAVGAQWQRNQTYLPYYSLGLQYTRLFSTNVKGNVTEFSAPGFLNYNYNFKSLSNLYTVTGKFDLLEYRSFMPYLAASLGAGYNILSNYSENATPNVTPRFSPDYASNDNVNFIYTLGAGVDYKWSNTWWFTVGYEYQNLGNLSSGPGSSTWSSTRVNLGTLKNNMIFASVTYHLPSTI